MNPSPVLLLRALSALLTYPDGELRAALPEISAAIRDAQALDNRQKHELLALADEIAGSDPLAAEGRYVDLFDRGRATCLNLFEHVHGDGRERGPAMLELRQRYLDAGLEPTSGELPDHLPLLLEYLSCCQPAEIRATLGEIAHILRKLGNALLQRGSRYAAVMAALLTLGGEPGLDAHAPAPPPEDLDRAWEEQPAFAPPEPETTPAPEGLAR
ncbi:MAG: nitrate reductase molybdenum cofactor assembly chaperone [Gammaproteobacteria bacterium]|nr:nitrate reductase molybdenum cofactor assembly chaperone [Gammaproteobacteria bacterium]MBU6510552.1 nitrate reductase molybdenum cofactor assembly chaperone [Gammaproteobacteria bacterium]MDE1984685.1 nitrate reductase molybdenum cofactor assembly chaperone [Gammaproteobacteria bacterium]MDE2109022.1 nitrate reductase molybdenum cofactor assembly chaperone [Gammaproteobacteria bacterium]MDE2461062.1 nitrate reductase molybdenum cofactor assembly chaperone [Gammaproteobacteria bacterium]